MFEAAVNDESRSAWTNPSQVYVSASTATGQPSLAAVADVTGLRLARRISRPIRGRAASGRRAWRRSVIAELVRVIQSTDPSSSRAATVGGNASASALR